MVANTEESRCNWRRTDYVNYTEGIGITYHGFEPEDEPERIDYIYIKKAKEGYQTFPYEMSYEAFEEKFLDPQIARKIFQRAGFDVTFFITPATGHLFWKKPGVKMAKITIKH